MEFSEEVLVRIFIGESDRHGRLPAYEAILDFLKSRGVAGATVCRGIAGYGARSVIHTQKILEISHDLPIVVEVVDKAESIEPLLPLLKDFLTGGLMTVQPLRVFHPSINPGI